MEIIYLDRYFIDDDIIQDIIIKDDLKRRCRYCGSKEQRINMFTFEKPCIECECGLILRNKTKYSSILEINNEAIIEEVKHLIGRWNKWTV